MSEKGTENHDDRDMCENEKYTLTDVMSALNEINNRITKIEAIIEKNNSSSISSFNRLPESESTVKNTSTQTAITTNTNVMRKRNTRPMEVEDEGENEDELETDGVIDDNLIEMIKQDKNLSELLERAKESSQSQYIRMDEIDLGLGGRLLILLIVIGIVYIVRYF